MPTRLGVDPTNFGGTNLVTRLLATEQTSVRTPDCSGTRPNFGDEYVGTYMQGLVFTALKAVGQQANAAAISWLTSQQCPSGGWALPNQAEGMCAVDPSSFEGNDNQSTSLAVQGLAAQGALTPGIAASATSFFISGQDAEGGWSYYPKFNGTAATDRLAIHRASDPSAVSRWVNHQRARRSPRSGTSPVQRLALLRGDVGE